ncbi:MAG: GDSL-type esterase/lipase family protein [Ignavibacteria bacterium]|nr:GDSL-type esterase/lipase family protein [Ignavibacteria bacterium]
MRRTAGRHVPFSRFPAQVIFTFLLIVLAIGSQAIAQDNAATAAVRFAADIGKSLKADSINPPPKNGILFIGSSIFRQWAHVKEHMAPLPAFNRAFGGSRTHEVLYYTYEIVLPYELRIIVYYCGSNDIAGGVKPQVVLRNFKAFCERVKTKLPETKIFFVSINKAPSRIARWGAMDSANAMIGAYCHSTKDLDFIDVNSILFDSAGKPRLELYRDDKLHFKDLAYLEFTAVIRPVIEKAWKGMN